MLGVYVASYNQPVFLRHCLLQIAAQTRLPDVLAIYENATKTSSYWAIHDVVENLTDNGVIIDYRHSSERHIMPTFFCLPLQILIDRGCDLFQKLDVDDIYYKWHLGYLESLADTHPSFDAMVNRNSGLLVIPNSGDYKAKDSIEWGMYNPIGGHPNNLIFRKNVAEVFVKAMAEHTGYNDDVVFDRYVRPHFRYGILSDIPTSCYVAHNKTVSTSNWCDNPPAEVY